MHNMLDRLETIRQVIDFLSTRIKSPATGRANVRLITPRIIHNLYKQHKKP